MFQNLFSLFELNMAANERGENWRETHQLNRLKISTLTSNPSYTESYNCKNLQNQIECKKTDSEFALRSAIQSLDF